MSEASSRDRVRDSSFVHKILNSQTVTNLLIFLLVLIIIFMITKLSYLLAPVWEFLSFVAFPIIGAGIFYYLLAPIVAWLEQKGLQKRYGILLIFLVITIVFIIGISTLVPILRYQSQAFLESLPEYGEKLDEFWYSLSIDLNQYRIMTSIEDFISYFNLGTLTDHLNRIITSTFGGVTNVIGTITHFVTGIFTMPVLLYYLLLQGSLMPRVILYYVPTAIRPSFSRILFRSNFQISQYIRGQIVVAIIVGFLFAIGYTLIGLDYAILLAVTAGFLNVIPYLGSIISAIPAIIIGLLTSPLMFIKVLIVLAVEQFIEGRLVSPQVLGSNLKIHPAMILLILLGAGKLFGIGGIILGVPVYAVFKVIFSEIFRNFRMKSDLYDDPPLELPVHEESQEEA